MFFSLLTPAGSQGLERVVRFGHLTKKDGLSQNTVSAILQDRRGFLWFGTQEGLNRFDGYHFVVYKNDPADPGSLSNDFINSLYEDSSGRLWVGTMGGGVNRYDSQLDRFARVGEKEAGAAGLGSEDVSKMVEDGEGNLWIGTTESGVYRLRLATGETARFVHDDGDPGSLSGNLVGAMARDMENRIWIATSHGGLNRFNPADGKFDHFRHRPDDPQSLSSDNITALMADNNGYLWAGTSSGVDRMDPKSGRVERFPKESMAEGDLSSFLVFDIREDMLGDIWVGTREAGLFRYDSRTGRFVRYRNRQGDPTSISSNVIVSIGADSSGNMWFGTEQAGVSYLYLHARQFAHYSRSQGDAPGLSDNTVWSFLEDSAGNTWIGTSAGLNRFGPDLEEVGHFFNDPDDPDSLSYNTVTAIAEDSGGHLWFGTWGGGLNEYDPATEKFTRFKYSPDERSGLGANQISALLVDSLGRVWIGTNKGGLQRFDTSTRDFTTYLADDANPKSLSNNMVWSLAEDRSGDIWVGTADGLSRWRRDEDSFDRFLFKAGAPSGLGEEMIMSLHSDPGGALWVGTRGGLTRLDPTSGRTERYTEKDGLANNVVYCIRTDGAGTVWLSTNDGLSRFDPSTAKFTNFHEMNGLQDNEFCLGACMRRSSGELYFGGINGFNVFKGEEIASNEVAPEVVLTGFELFDAPVAIGQAFNGRVILPKAVGETESVQLFHDENTLSFEFAGLHFEEPTRNRYAYRLKGLDDRWREGDATRRFRSYNNLAPGRYVFEVKAANSEGVWSKKSASIGIDIVPPFWQTLWFRVLAVSALTALGVGAYRARVSTISRQKRKLERLVEERTRQVEKQKKELEAHAERQEELFRAIAHELRTPISRIRFSFDLAERPADDAEREDLAKIIDADLTLLDEMIEELLTYARFGASAKHLTFSSFNVSEAVEETLELFQGSAQGAGLRALPTEAELVADRRSFVRALRNLLDNARRYAETEVVVECAVRGRTLEISVTDDGPGVDEASREAIFEPFCRVDKQLKTKGAGLGLWIVRQIVKAHGGAVELTSAEAGRTVFTMIWPLDPRANPQKGSQPSEST